MMEYEKTGSKQISHYLVTLQLNSQIVVSPTGAGFFQNWRGRPLNLYLKFIKRYVTITTFIFFLLFSFTIHNFMFINVTIGSGTFYSCQG